MPGTGNCRADHHGFITGQLEQIPRGAQTARGPENLQEFPPGARSVHVFLGQLSGGKLDAGPRPERINPRLVAQIKFLFLHNLRRENSDNVVNIVNDIMTTSAYSWAEV